MALPIARQLLGWSMTLLEASGIAKVLPKQKLEAWLASLPDSPEAALSSRVLNEAVCLITGDIVRSLA